jgi:LysM repeat protein
MKYPSLWRIVAVVSLQACLTPAFAAPEKAQTGGTYAVKSGDTFARIARAKGVSLSSLLKANPLTNPDHLVPGKRIVIPGEKPAPSKEVASSAKKTPTKPTASKNTAIAKKPAAATVSPKKQLPLVTDTKRRNGADMAVNLTPPPAPKGSYIVQSGDTLGRIQRRTGTPVSELLRLNKLTATSTLRPGQTLRVSAAAGNSKTLAANAQKTSRPTAREDEKRVNPKQEAEPVKESRSNDRLAAYDMGSQPAPTGNAPHKVGAGETFSSIRRTYGITQAQLAKANPGIDPNRLHPGQTLLIPGQPVIPQSKAPVVRADGRVLAQRHDPLMAAGGVEETSSSEKTRTGYLVGDGDSIQKIAQRFNTSDREIRHLNRMGDTDDVYPGRYILVPFVRQANAPATYARHDT